MATGVACWEVLMFKSIAVAAVATVALGLAAQAQAADISGRGRDLPGAGLRQMGGAL